MLELVDGDRRWTWGGTRGEMVSQGLEMLRSRRSGGRVEQIVMQGCVGSGMLCSEGIGIGLSG